MTVSVTVSVETPGPDHEFWSEFVAYYSTPTTSGKNKLPCHPGANPEPHRPRNPVLFFLLDLLLEVFLALNFYCTSR